MTHQTSDHALAELLLSGSEIEAAAFRAFDRWVKDHDPDGNMEIHEQAIAYMEWASKNSIERYCDAAQPVNPQR